MGSLPRRVPGTLALLLAVAAIEAVAWIAVVPALQGPDQNSHFSYVQRIVEQKTVPWEPRGGPSATPEAPYSTELQVAEGASGLGALSNHVGARPLWTHTDERFFERQDAAGLDRANGGFTSALNNPPVYYLYEAPAYLAAYNGSFFDRQLVMRLWNVPLLLAAVLFTWLIAGQLLGAGLPRFLAAACVALLPQMLNMTATINPDVMLAAEWSAALWLMIRILKEGARRNLVAWLALVCTASALTHGRSLALFVPAAMAVLLAVARERGWSRVTPVRVGAVTMGVSAAAALIASELGRGSVRQFVSYVWQFYLPKLPFMDPAIGPPAYGFRQAFPDRLYGGLAHLEVTLPSGVETWLHRVTLAGLVALVLVLWLRRDAVRRNAGTAVVLGTAVLSLVLLLHVVAYRAMVDMPGDPIITGRYLLPLVSLFGVAVALIVRALPGRLAAAAAGLVVGSGVALQLGSIGLLVERFYA